MEVESNDEIVVDEIERVCDERVGWQRANLPCCSNGAETPPVIYEDRVYSRGGVIDTVSTNSPVIFCGKPGRARKYFVVPFAWCEVCLLYTSRCV